MIQKGISEKQTLVELHTTMEMVIQRKTRGIVDSSPFISAGQFVINDPVLGSTLAELYKKLRATISLNEWLERRSEIDRRVCRIEFERFNGPDGISPHGTGFLVAPTIVMTNWHVIRFLFNKSEEDLRRLLLRFDYTTSGAAGRTCRLARDWLVACHPKRGAQGMIDTDLDYALLRLSDSPGDDDIGGGAERGTIELPGRSIELQVDEPLCIVQHPNGAPLKLAVGLQGVRELKLPTRVTYQVNTEEGSSGSPVFDRNWQLVALHHAEVKNEPFNEGIPIDTIVAQLSRGARAALALR